MNLLLNAFSSYGECPLTICLVFSGLDGHHDSTVVSPENSEDGNFPTVAESNAAAVAFQLHHQQHQHVGSYSSHMLPAQPIVMEMASSIQQGIPLAPAPPGTLYNPSNVAMPPGMGMGMFLQQPPQLPVVAAPTVNGPAAPKRRRVETVDGSTLAVAASSSSSSNPMNGRQLANGEDALLLHVGSSRKKSQAQIDRRRERNRILARRTRLRKKFFFESLQKEVMDLQRENEMLKDVVKVDIGGDESKKILDTCDAADRMPPGVLEACSEEGMNFDSQDFNLVRSIQDAQHSFIITDPSLTDNPIVFASDGFLELTGYERDQVLGRNCRFLQGTDTSKESVEEVGNAIKNGEDVSITMINYTADGTPFWNKLFIAALRDAQNNIVNYIGVIVKVATPEPGHPEHGKMLGEVKRKAADDDDDDDESVS